MTTSKASTETGSTQPTSSAKSKSPGAAARSDKRGPTKARAAADGRGSRAGNSSAKKSNAVPASLVAGASVAASVAAVAVTLFATREKWMGWAKEVGERVQRSASKSEARNVSDDDETPVAAPTFEASGANAGFDAGVGAQ